VVFFLFLGQAGEREDVGILQGWLCGFGLWFLSYGMDGWCVRDERLGEAEGEAEGEA